MSTSQAKVTASGQISLPAALRRRWSSGAVLVVDRGDYAIIRPIPAEPVAALKGAHAGPGPTTDNARAAERRAAESAEERRRSR